MQSQKIIPNIWSYLLLQSGILVIWVPLFCLLASASQFPLFFSEVWIWVNIFLFGAAFILFLLFGIIVAWTYITYRKEQYIFESTKIIYNSGTLFSDNTTEVKVDKITQVSVVFPFWQYLIFKTGYISIKTAGSSGSEILLKHVDKSLEIYEGIQDLMRNNGYHLTKDTLVQEARPHILGIIGDIWSRAFSTIIILLYILFSIIFGDNGEDNIDYSEIVSMVDFTLINSIIGSIIVIGIFIYIAIAYLDLRRRKYEVFTDSIFYTEGFLTKHYSFLPMERVADIENRQSFLSRILGLHDLVISSEWSNNSVVFKNMTWGEQMIKNIKYLKSQITMQPQSAIATDTSVWENSILHEDLVGYTDTVEAAPQYNNEFRATYKMYPLKVFLWTIILAIIAVFAGIFLWGEIAGSLIVFIIIFSISSIIQFFFTDYVVDTSTIEKKFHFLSKRHSSFTVDKISGVVIRESLLDRMLGSCSIVFWSIASGSNITFSNIKKTPTLENDILQKVGIYIDISEKKNLDVKLNLIEYIKHSFFWVLVLLFVIITITVISILLEVSTSAEDTPFSFIAVWIYVIVFFLIFALTRFLYNKFYYSASWYKQSLYKDFVESISGIIFRSKKYSLYRHIKWLSATKNPLTSVGNVSLSVAGQVMSSTQNSNTSSVILAWWGYFENNIRFDYMVDAFALLDTLDEILKWDKIDTTEIISSSQDIGNSIIVPSIFIVITVFLVYLTLPMWFTLWVLIIGVLVIGVITWYISTKRYILEKDRAISEFGIIYRVRKTILYKKFNFIEKYQGFLGKIFKNGTLSIYTLWSSSRDMVLSDVDKYIEVYDLLKKD